MNDALLRPADLERDYGISPSTLATWRASNFGPASFKLGRRVVYRRSVVEAWIAEQERAAAS